MVAKDKNKQTPQATKRMKKARHDGDGDVGDMIEASYAEAQVDAVRDKRSSARGLVLWLGIGMGVIALCVSGVTLFEQRKMVADQRTALAELSEQFMTETGALTTALQAKEAELSALEKRLLALQDKVAAQNDPALSAATALSADGFIAWELWQMISQYQHPAALMPLIEKLRPSENKTALLAITEEAATILAADLLAQGQSAIGGRPIALITDEIQPEGAGGVFGRMMQWAAGLVQLRPVDPVSVKDTLEDKKTATMRELPYNSIAALYAASAGQDSAEIAAWRAKIDTLARFEARLLAIIDNWLIGEGAHS